jgi:kynurenine formamidase
MIIEITHQQKQYKVNLGKGIDCSSTYGLASAEPRAWHTPPVKIEPVTQGNWVGSVQAGAPVNFYKVQLNPHGNGTHTECLGHISPEKQSINAFLPGYHGLVQFIKLKPNAQGCVTLKSLQALELNLALEALAIAVPAPFPHDFSGTHPPYFEPELMAFVREQGVKHFITNLPSVDPEEDAGALSAHKAFWQYPLKPRLKNTITELAYFPPNLANGLYFLNLQVAPLHNDAAPSRPVFFALEDKNP